MDPNRLADYRDRIEADLRENVLPFWVKRMVNQEQQTFYAKLTHEGEVDDSQPRGSLLTSRILWTYSAAYRVFSEPEYLRMAELAYRDLEERFWDADQGGYVWSVHPDGSWKRDRKQVYGQAFAIYALSEFHWATGNDAALTRAQELFDLVEKRGSDPDHGGYLEAFARDWSPIEDMRLSEVDQNDPKSQNTLLHVMEAYTNLLRIWPDARVRDALRRLVETMLDRVVDADTFHLGLFFARDWSPTSDAYSYGHDIEASWLLWEAGMAVNDPELKHRLLSVVLKIADVTLAEGLDADGAVFNEGGPDGIRDDVKEWWPQAEAMVGFLNAAQLSGEEHHLDAALKLWDFIETKIIDPVGGEWFRGVTRQGEVITTFEKAGFWKCPYHNSRAALEAISRLNALGATPTAASV